MIEEKVVDYQQGKKVVGLLYGYFSSKKEVANIEYPSNIEYGSNQYLLYMFYSCLLDYGMRSKIYHKNLSTTYAMYSDIFNPSYVVNAKEDLLKDIIVNNIHPRYPNIAVKKWIELSKGLQQYDSILSYLKTLNSFEELEYFVRNIKGYGQKTGGLLIRIICDVKICNFKENTKSIPIDRHDIEISYLTGIISKQKVGNKEINALSEMYVKIGNELNINPSNIDKYLWEIGNSFCNNKQCDNCPLNECCNIQKRSDFNAKE